MKYEGQNSRGFFLEKISSFLLKTIPFPPVVLRFEKAEPSFDHYSLRADSTYWEHKSREDEKNLGA